MSLRYSAGVARMDDGPPELIAIEQRLRGEVRRADEGRSPVHLDDPVRAGDQGAGRGVPGSLPVR
jgi:hypothetical protein